MESKGKILGQEVTFLATFWAMEQAPGRDVLEGPRCPDDQGRRKGHGAGSGDQRSVEGARLEHAGLPVCPDHPPALKKLNEVAIVFEIEITPDGTVKDKWWEWK